MRFDLEPLGYPGQSVDLIDPLGLPYPECVKLLERTNRGELRCYELVRSWSVLDAETGEPLGPPSPETFDRLPAGVAAAITDEIDRLLADSDVSESEDATILYLMEIEDMPPPRYAEFALRRWLWQTFGMKLEETPARFVIDAKHYTALEAKHPHRFQPRKESQ